LSPSTATAFLSAAAATHATTADAVAVDAYSTSAPAAADPAADPALVAVDTFTADTGGVTAIKR